MSSEYRYREVKLDSQGDIIPEAEVLYFAILESGAKISFDWCWKAIDARLHSAEAKFHPDYPSMCTSREIKIRASQQWYPQNTQLREWIEERHKHLRLLLMGLKCQNCGQPMVDANFDTEDMQLRKCDDCLEVDRLARVRNDRRNGEGEGWKKGKANGD